MQEFVILLSSTVGIFSALAFKKIPKRNNKLEKLGASSYIQSKINSLKIEKEILTKSISRIYGNDPSLTEIQRDKLLLRYQHQLGVIIAKIEKMEIASQHPDLGPLGDGLITLMDQKLSSLDKRLFELSSKITSQYSPEIKEKSKVVSYPKEPTKIEKIIHEKSIPVMPEIVTSKQHNPFELTTLTEISDSHIEFPFEISEQEKPKEEVIPVVNSPQEKMDSITTIQPIDELPNKPENTQEPITNIDQIIPEPEKNKAKPVLNLPEEDSLEEDDDDLDKIKGQILKTLSKLQQAEVE